MASCEQLAAIADDAAKKGGNMKLALRMMPAAMTVALLLVAPSHARNYDCSKAGNANKTTCKNAAAPAPAAASTAPVTKTDSPAPATRHYDCSKAGNANKAICKGAASAPAAMPSPGPVGPSRPTAPAATRTPVSRSTTPATTNPSGPNGATAICTDGSYSHSAHRSGTCSRHGGVKSWN